jgi:hypothetical protein
VHPLPVDARLAVHVMVRFCLLLYAVACQPIRSDSAVVAPTVHSGDAGIFVKRAGAVRARTANRGQIVLAVGGVIVGVPEDVPGKDGDITLLLGARTVHVLEAADDGMYWAQCEEDSCASETAGDEVMLTTYVSRAKMVYQTADRVVALKATRDWLYVGVDGLVHGAQILRIRRQGDHVEQVLWRGSAAVHGLVVAEGRVIALADASVVAIDDETGAVTRLGAIESKPTGLAADSQYVYWTEEGGDDCLDGRVMKLPLAGGPAQILARDHQCPRSAALFAGSVYWLNIRGELVGVDRMGGPSNLVADRGTNCNEDLIAGKRGLYWSWHRCEVSDRPEHEVIYRWVPERSNP